MSYVTPLYMGRVLVGMMDVAYLYAIGSSSSRYGERYTPRYTVRKSRNAACLLAH
jgi:hypothetical protein